MTKPIVINDKKWVFCTKCRCRATGNVGFYQLSHTDETHDPNWKPEGNASPIQDPDPTPLQPIRPVLEEPPDDDLVFTGVNCTPVLWIPRSHDEREKRLELGGDNIVCMEAQAEETERRKSKFGMVSVPDHVIDLTLSSKFTKKCNN